MPIIRAQVVFNSSTGLQEDRQVNVLHFLFDDAPDETNMGQLKAALQTFYQTWDSSIHVASLGAAPQVTITYYDLADPEPRAPIDQSQITLTSSAVAPLPGEVTICLNFKNVTESGVALGRKRGRIYLPGPWDESANTPSGTILSATLNGIGDAAAALRDTTTGQGIAWGIYSRLNNVAYQVEQISLDNAWDTQRRRGRDATQYRFSPGVGVAFPDFA